jgi:hypothetical protein
VKLISKIGLVGIAASAAVGGALMFASSANADTTGPILDTPSYINFDNPNCTPGVTTHLDYKWVSDVTNAGPTMWTVDNAAPGTKTNFLWKGVPVPYHRDGTKTQPATDWHCGLRITNQTQADALMAQGTVTKDAVDVPQGADIQLRWMSVNANVTVEGKLNLAASTINGNVEVTGPSSGLWLFNDPSRISGNLSVHDSSGAWNGSAGTSFFDNADQQTQGHPYDHSQIGGNFNYWNNTGWLYVGAALDVSGNFIASGNGPYTNPTVQFVTDGLHAASSSIL